MVEKYPKGTGWSAVDPGNLRKASHGGVAQLSMGPYFRARPMEKIFSTDLFLAQRLAVWLGFPCADWATLNPALLNAEDNCIIAICVNICVHDLGCNVVTKLRLVPAGLSGAERVMG